MLRCVVNRADKLKFSGIGGLGERPFRSIFDPYPPLKKERKSLKLLRYLSPNRVYICMYIDAGASNTVRNTNDAVRVGDFPGLETCFAARGEYIRYIRYFLPYIACQ